jgi:hypothetical protein
MRHRALRTKAKGKRQKAKGKSGGEVTSFALSSALPYDDTAGQFIFAFCPFALPPQAGQSF